jgi:hypothetical protein
MPISPEVPDLNLSALLRAVAELGTDVHDVAVVELPDGTFAAALVLGVRGPSRITAGLRADRLRRDLADTTSGLF